MAHEASHSLVGCPHCGLVQRAAPVRQGFRVRCSRCSGTVRNPNGNGRNQLCAAIALAALIIYLPAITLPVMRLERLGHINETSVWGGSISLITSGHLFIGLIVLVCSVVIPVVKLAGLFTLTPPWPIIHARRQAKLYRWIELAGRWGMIDVLLVAMVVAAVKLGDLVSVSPGPGVVAFTVCVLLSLIASAVFHPHSIWENTSGKETVSR